MICSGYLGTYSKKYWFVHILMNYDGSTHNIYNMLTNEYRQWLEPYILVLNESGLIAQQ